ncbi:MAG: transposase [Proteobacteria bacterium]|nr:transposase [Pseudomonadota bacterium]
MNVTKPRRIRRTHSEEFKRSLIEACGKPGASVAGVALAHGVNANQLRRWMRERGINPPELSCLPLRVAASEPMGGFVPVQLPHSLDPPIRLELRKGVSVVTVEWPASSAATCGAWLREWLG